MFNQSSMMADFDLGLLAAFGDQAEAPPISTTNAAPMEDENVLNEATNISLMLLEEPQDNYITSWAQKMEVDKRAATAAVASASAVDETRWLEATSDLQAFLDLTDVSEVGEADSLDTQALIEEVEDFLQNHDQVAANGDGDDGDNSTFTHEETQAAEQLLDSLLSGEVDLDFNLDNEEATSQPIVENTHAPAEAGSNDIKVEADESGFFDMSNISQIVTEDGRNIVIMIAPPSPQPVLKDNDESLVGDPQSVSPHHSSVDGDDSDWAPDSPSPKGRPPVKRNAKARSKGGRNAPYTVTDRKERKKLQNVEAARRYRDKKKVENNDIEIVEEELAEKNKALKSQLSEMESEVKTMRKLMVELGILKPPRV